MNRVPGFVILLVFVKLFHGISNTIYSRMYRYSTKKVLISLLVLSKVGHKISVPFGPIQNFKISDLTMAKVEKVNIAVTKFYGAINLSI